MTRPARPDRNAFTLVELLVVVGIIALLVGILLPALSRAREAGNRAKCLSNVRQLAAAAIMYSVENDGRLPEAMWDNGNVFGSPYSPRGSKYRGWSGPWAAWTPIGTGAWGPGSYVMPSIGGALSPYLGTRHDGLWTCPSAPPVEAGRRGAIYSGDDPYGGSAGSPAFAAPDGDRWLPNYHYMGMKGYLWHVNGGNPPATVAAFHLDDWLVRNVAGVKAPGLRSVSGQGSSEIVLFREVDNVFHTRATRDVYDLAPGETGDYGMTFAFLDGHAEYRAYGDVNGLLAAHSDPIAQSWFSLPGQEWSTRFAVQYARRYRAD